jgi:hypothetical protein
MRFFSPIKANRHTHTHTQQLAEKKIGAKMKGRFQLVIDRYTLRSTTPYDDDGLVEFFFFSPPLHV